MKFFLLCLLKLFPPAFQKKMGQAWLETMECQWEAARHQGTRFQSAFKMITLHLVVSLPQSYSYAFLSLMRTSENKEAYLLAGDAHVMARLRNRTPAPLQQIGRHLLVFSGGCLFSFSIGLLFILSIENSVLWFGLMASLVILGISTILYSDKLSPYQRVLVPGIILGGFLSFSYAFAIYMEKNHAEGRMIFDKYTALSHELGGSYPGYSHQEWFTVTGELKPAYHQQYCENAISSLALWNKIQTQNISPNHILSSLLIQSLSLQNYALGCVSDTDLFQINNAGFELFKTMPLSSSELHQPRRSYSIFDFVTLITLGDYHNRMRLAYSPQSHCRTVFAQILSEKKIPTSNQVGVADQYCEKKPGKNLALMPRHWWEWIVMTPSFIRAQDEYYAIAPRISVSEMRQMKNDIAHYIHDNPHLFEAHLSHQGKSP